MTIEGCVGLLLIAVYIIWVTLSRRDWKRRALRAEWLLGRRLKDLRVKGEE